MSLAIFIINFNFIIFRYLNDIERKYLFCINCYSTESYSLRAIVVLFRVKQSINVIILIKLGMIAFIAHHYFCSLIELIILFISNKNNGIFINN